MEECAGIAEVIRVTKHPVVEIAEGVEVGGSAIYAKQASLNLASSMPYLATILITLLLAVPAMSDELFRYRGAARDG